MLNLSAGYLDLNFLFKFSLTIINEHYCWRGLAFIATEHIYSDLNLELLGGCAAPLHHGHMKQA